MEGGRGRRGREGGGGIGCSASLDAHVPMSGATAATSASVLSLPISTRARTSVLTSVETGACVCVPAVLVAALAGLLVAPVEALLVEPVGLTATAWWLAGEVGSTCTKQQDGQHTGEHICSRGGLGRGPGCGCKRQMYRAHVMQLRLFVVTVQRVHNLVALRYGDES